MNYSLSVIIPAYNSEKTLPETLNSLLGQSVHIQIITVNDGSSDGTSRVAHTFANAHSNIIVIDKQNGGVSSARNAGIDYAQGKYTLFLDADDLLADGSAEAMIKAMDESNADVGIFRLQRFGYGGNEYNPVCESLSKKKEISVYDKELLYNYLVGNKCYRTSVLKESKILYPPTAYSEDGAFWISFIMKMQPKIAGIPGAAVKYRRTNPSVTVTVSQSVKHKHVSDFFESMDIAEEAINEAFDSESCSCADKVSYIEEFRYKICHTIINEFYRKIWSAEDDALSLLESKFNTYFSLLSDESKSRLSKDFEEIGKPVFSKTELAKKPLISILCRNPKPEFLNSLYLQSMVRFEFVGDNAGAYSDFENVSGAPNGKIILHFKGTEILDPRILRAIYLLKNSGLGFIPVTILKHLAKIYLKIKDMRNK